MGKILTKIQKKTLDLIAKSSLSKQFYFSGGTALAEYYLQHRLSEDLDFFCEEEFEPQSIYVIIKSYKAELNFQEIDFQSSFNRNLFFLQFYGDQSLKLEFTYYPFQQVEPPTNRNGILVDSLIDIATNKLFTISQKPRGRDYFDLYSIIMHKDYSIERLRILAKQKFDWHVDPLQLASRLYEVDQHLDDPILTKTFNKETMSRFFRDAALAFESKIIKR